MSITALFGIQLPLIQAPMAGATTPDMVVAVSEAGGLGSLASAQYTPAQLHAALTEIRARTTKPINLNFFCHENPVPDAAAQAQWLEFLAPYYKEAGLEAVLPDATPARAPFNAAFCEIVEEIRPEVVSFHFGLPEAALLARVRATGAKIISSATTVEEAHWLAAQGVDTIIAMGVEAGGHRGNFLTQDMSAQPSLHTLLQQMKGKIKLPVIAAGGLATAAHMREAIALGATAAQVGTAYLFTQEANVSALYRQALESADKTALTNLFTGRPARGIINRLMRELGPLNAAAPAFPTAGAALAPLRKAAEANGKTDFTNLWAGQNFAASTRSQSAVELTKLLAAGAT